MSGLTALLASSCAVRQTWKNSLHFLLRPLRIVLAVWVTVGSLNCFHPVVLVRLLDRAYSATLFQAVVLRPLSVKILMGTKVGL